MGCKTYPTWHQKRRKTPNMSKAIFQEVITINHPHYGILIHCHTNSLFLFVDIHHKIPTRNLKILLVCLNKKYSDGCTSSNAKILTLSSVPLERQRRSFNCFFGLAISQTNMQLYRMGIILKYFFVIFWGNLFFFVVVRTRCNRYQGRENQSLYLIKSVGIN